MRLDTVIKEHVIAMLNQHEQNVWHTAVALGISRRAFYRLMAKHGIHQARHIAPVDARMIHRARAAVAKAIKQGMKRGPCEVCGQTQFVQAHHDNYRKPLEIRWLCHKHHAQLEGAKRRQKR